jgi:hypothetical protein
MRQEVIVQFGTDQDHVIPVHNEPPLLPPDQARRWLDQEFVANDCEPLRASGKVLIADKVLALASTVGERRFIDDAAWAQAYARATLAALARPVVRVDVSSSAISY